MNTELQKIIDRAVPLLRKQGRKSYVITHRHSYQCQYRNGYGGKCLFGHLIADEYYDDIFEGISVDRGLIVSALQKSNPDIDFSVVPLTALAGLQLCHDTAGPRLGGFEKSLAAFCSEHGLRVPS